MRIQSSPKMPANEKPSTVTDKHRRPSARLTSYDVASAAGVSQSSVSRAFDPDGSIDPELRRRIKRVARELGWRPNSIASSLQKRRTDFIGLITAELDSPWRAQQLGALIPALEEAGHRPLIFHTNRESEIDDLVDEVLSYQGRAVIVGAGLMSARISKLCAKRGLLVILLNRWTTAAGVVPISCDHRAGAGMAVDYLATRGCRRLIFLQGNLDSYAGQQRSLGFLERSHALGLDTETLQMASFERQQGRQAAALIASRPRAEWPDAILAANDAMALGVMDHAYATGDFTIPKDFALIGFDDLHESAAPAYQLTTVQQPLDAVTSKVVSLLDDWRGVAKRARVVGHMLTPCLIERRSGLWTSAT
jgi:DNA-binding LacI/PurR family transcriptional regulator